jgi:hypothetical protein
MEPAAEIVSVCTYFTTNPLDTTLAGEVSRILRILVIVGATDKQLSAITSNLHDAFEIHEHPRRPTRVLELGQTASETQAISAMRHVPTY